MSSLYRVKFIDQQSGEELLWYVLANNIAQVEDDFADIISIDYLSYTDLTKEQL